MATKLEYYKSVRYGAANGANGSSAKQPVMPGPIAYVDCYTSRSGVSMPDWKTRIRQGRNATTNYDADFSQHSSSPAVQLLHGNNRTDGASSGNEYITRTGSHITAPPPLPNLQDLTLATNIASTRFYKDLENVLTLFAGGTFLGELRETLHMIRRPGQALRKGVGSYLEALKKGRRGSRLQRERFLRSTWLEYSFGWSPFLSDLREAADYLEKRQDQLVQELIPVFGMGESKGVTFGFNNYVTGGGNLYCPYRTTWTSIQVYAGAVSSRASNTTLLNANNLGLSPRSFVPTIWEVMPWSFAIDYFTNIGDVISAWSNQNVGLAWGRDTKVRLGLSEAMQALGFWPSHWRHVYYNDISTGSDKALRRNVIRRRINTPPIPSFSFELPGFGTKWLNLAALTASRRRLTPF